MDDPAPLQMNFQLQKELKSENSKYLILVKAETSTELTIEATKDDKSKTVYKNNFTLDVIKENKYFFQFDDLNEICCELSQRFDKEKISIIEKTNSIIISIPLPSTKIKEINFELKEEEKKYDKEVNSNKINELMALVKEQNEQIINLKKEIEELKQFKKNVSFLLKNYITNLDSLILDNNNYNTIIKNWINPKIKLRANLLYRISRDGPEIYTFHQLCDNKGPTLTLIDLRDGNKIGFYVSDSFDSYSGWKNDDNSFIFNLNQNKKYKKINPQHSAICCKSDSGPSVNGLGCNDDISLYYIYHSRDFIDKCYENGSKILPSKKSEEEYEVLEMEIFQVLKD